MLTELPDWLTGEWTFKWAESAIGSAARETAGGDRDSGAGGEAPPVVWREAKGAPGSGSVSLGGAATLALTVRREARSDSAAGAGEEGLELATLDIELAPPAGGTLPLAGWQLLMPVVAPLACVWKPHLSPEDGMAIGDKAFRSPAIVFEDETRMTALLPSLDSVGSERLLPHICDYTAADRTLMYGGCDYEEEGHVYYRLTPRVRTLDRALRVRLRLVSWRKAAGAAPRDLRRVERLLWTLEAGCRMAPGADPGAATATKPEWAAGRATAGDTAADDASWTVARARAGTLAAREDAALFEAKIAALRPYVDHAYGWAFERWGDVSWQQFRLGGTEVGGVAFLVTARQQPGGGREDSWREPKSLWNQAWFCGLRSAYGYASWGKRMDRDDWLAKAGLALNFALAAPKTQGLFPGYYQAGEDGSWESGRWYMSGPRRPHGHEDFVHLLDSSWTCYWLLKWYRDIGSDARILPYVGAYVEALLALQREDGSFPAWVRPDTREASPFLAVSPETSAHVMLLCLYGKLTGDARSIEAAARGGGFVAAHILPEGRWEDFETYWSCSREWAGKLYGERDARSGLYNQCNFGMYWTAEAFKDLYETSGEASWLALGEQVLAEASLYQQIWQPPYVPVPTIGGFGVMNTDDEWNDARQSLFALTYLSYANLTGDERYRIRALRAMEASFYMMYCPENDVVKRLYERVHPGFGTREYGFHMENFNHHDGTPVDGLGEFTIFDWGCGAASASLAEFTAMLNGGTTAADKGAHA
ncbi:hypothetical protein [Cohnella hashimotonis]|uniref:Uncharacterized protein n=1 Tax=Cohnella hashimotonis TaxID=2826895 RepID=A0ABT6TB88_9BACL|nr:hypothetical protein [Cohnella hashimotonis]MDI4644085.1 hypothetical protein [Cohnella hashimotonis]